MKTKLLILVVLLISLYSCQEDITDEIKPQTDELSSVLIEQAFPEVEGEDANIELNGQPCDCRKVNNQYVFQGDIVLTPEQIEKSNNLKGAGVSTLAKRWTGNIVYYTINSALPNQTRVTQAISHWQAN